MADLWSSRVWTKQPNASAHPLATFGGYEVGPVITPYATYNAQPLTKVGGIAARSGAAGLAWEGNAVTKYVWTRPRRPYVLAAGNSLTFVTVVSATGVFNTQGQGAMGFGTSNSGTTGNSNVCGLNIFASFVDLTNPFIRLGIWDSAGTSVYFNNPNSSSLLNSWLYTPRTVVCTFDVGTGSSARLFGDGQFISSATSSTIPTPTTFDLFSACVLLRNSTAFYTSTTTNIFLAAAIYGKLRDDEAISLSANPWQLFAPQRQVTYFGTSGGTVYNVDISETSTGSDSVSASVIWLASLSETATASDSLTTTVVFPTAVSETVTGTDSSTSSFVFSPAVSETATGLDTADSAFALASAVSETATASETNTSSLIVYPSVSETATASESISTVLIIYPSISETASAADTITTIATLNVGVTETVTAADIVTGATTMTVALSETATASDSVAGANTIGTAIAETATASESLAASVIFLSAVDEAVTASESISTIATQNVAVVETAGAADSLLINGSYQVFLIETVVGGDAITSRFLWEPIDTDQTPGWSNISTVQTAGWSGVDTTQTPGWSNISTTQNANWSSITTTQTANWQPVNTGS